MTLGTKNGSKKKKRVRRSVMSMLKGSGRIDAQRGVYREKQSVNVQKRVVGDAVKPFDLFPPIPPKFKLVSER